MEHIFTLVNNCKAKIIKELKGRLQLCLRQIDQNFVQKLDEQVKKRLNHIKRFGV